MFTYRKVGGLHFIAAGQFSASFCLTPKRASFWLRSPAAFIAAPLIGIAIAATFT